MPVPLPAGTSLGIPQHPPPCGVPRLPIAWPSHSGPRALPIPSPCPFPPWPPLSPGCRCWRCGVGLFLGMSLSCLHVCLCEPLPTEPHGRPVPGSLLGCREPLCTAATPGAGGCERGMLEGPGASGADGVVGRGLAWQEEWRGDTRVGVMWLRGVMGLRGCPWRGGAWEVYRGC